MYFAQYAQFAQFTHFFAVYGNFIPYLIVCAVCAVCAICVGRVGERDLDGLQTNSLEIVKRVQQKKAKEKCCFCLARNELNNM